MSTEGRVEADMMIMQGDASNVECWFRWAVSDGGSYGVNGRTADRRWCVRRDRRNVRADYE
jgi:hypothetical protein